MKKLQLITFIFAMTFGTMAQAQFGIKAGANFSTAFSYGNTEEGESLSLKPGFQIGAFYNHNLSEKLDLMVELNFENRGTVSKKDYTFQLPTVTPLGIINADYAVNQEIKATMGYVNIPILFKFKLGKINPYIGPNIGFLLSAKGSIDRTVDVSAGGMVIAQNPTNNDDIDFLDYAKFTDLFSTAPPEDGNFLNTFEFGINIGAMYNITENIYVDLRIIQGLSDVTNNYYDNSIYPTDLATNQTNPFPSREDADRNIGIQVSFGYMFGATDTE